MKVLLVIVTYNSIKWIDECLKSVFGSSVAPDVYIVDNKSKDDTVSFLKAHYSEKIIFYQSEENLGFGKGNNVGLKYALENNYDYVFLLNHDAFLETNTIERLLFVAEQNRDYGILSPIHLNLKGDGFESYFSDFMSLKYSKSFYQDHVINKKVKDIYPLQFINAAAWLIPKNILNEIGGFDPIFWHYGEDDNYCQRVLYHNYKIGVVSGCYIRHDSNIRIFDNEYNFSKQYYLDFKKDLQKKYGNLNYNFTVNILKYEKKKVLKKMIISIFEFKFLDIVGHSKKIKLLHKIIAEILNSREINKIKASNYIS